MNITRVTFGMLNVAVASVLIANLYLFGAHASSPKTTHLLSDEKVPGPNLFTPAAQVDKLNIALPKKEEPMPDLYKKQKNIITFNTNPTPGVMYRVQILTSKTQIPLYAPEFKNLDNIKEEYEGGLYKYTVGEFRTSIEAEPTFLNLKKKGYDDILLVVYKDGKSISLHNAVASLKNKE